MGGRIPAEIQFLNEDFGWEDHKIQGSEGAVPQVHGPNQIRFGSINLPDLNLEDSQIISPVGLGCGGSPNTQLMLWSRDVPLPDHCTFQNLGSHHSEVQCVRGNGNRAIRMNRRRMRPRRPVPLAINSHRTPPVSSVSLDGTICVEHPGTQCVENEKGSSYNNG